MTSSDSQAGRGATVALLLPVSGAALEETGPVPTLSAPVDALRPRSRIVIVDDDPVVRSALAASFEVPGHDVVAAADGPSAIGLLDRERALESSRRANVLKTRARISRS